MDLTKTPQFKEFLAAPSERAELERQINQVASFIRGLDRHVRETVGTYEKTLPVIVEMRKKKVRQLQTLKESYAQEYSSEKLN